LKDRFSLRRHCLARSILMEKQSNTCEGIR
jgi:hypothetical protein